ncbi:hypothetical protein VIN30_07080 [Adlercreutzia sp. R7]|uniref:Uncharacterized protein n=1 Tax=Adlercreutzia wanghongyangiae TaxID=3111451 RepID=A0ABU6IID6_9ACTN|nr:hypothetical protein [Adlercreutzia sp. R7]
MGYTELVGRGISATDLRKHLTGGDTVAVTARIPANLRDSAKEEIVLRGTTISALLRECLIDETVRQDRQLIAYAHLRG